MPTVHAPRSTPVVVDDQAVDSAPTIHGELLCEALDIHPGERVLDVGTGNGAAAIAAARHRADVIATDRDGQVLDAVLRVADAYRLAIDTRVAQAHDLPFEDDTFDVVMSGFGAMLAPARAAFADEAIRVCRPCGRIGLVTWTPGSLIGDVVNAAGRGGASTRDRRTVEWGTEDRLRQLFGNRISALRVTSRQFTFRYRSPQQMLEYFRIVYEPTRTAFDALDTDGRNGLAAALLEVAATYNRATDGTLVAPGDYLEVVATVR